MRLGMRLNAFTRGKEIDMKSKSEIKERTVSQTSRGRTYGKTTTERLSVIRNVGIGDKLKSSTEKRAGRKQGSKDKKKRKPRKK